MKNQNPQPKSYEEAIPLVRSWVSTQKSAYSLTVPEKHAALTEVGGAHHKAATPSPEKQLEKQLKAQEGRLTKKFAEKIEVLQSQLAAGGKGKQTGALVTGGGWR